MGLLIAITFALLTSAWVVAGTIRAARVLGVGIDKIAGVQKTHTYWVPRLGGIAIFVSLVSGLLLLAWCTGLYVKETAFLVVTVLPAFGIGLLEDFTERVSARTRLVFTMISAALGWWLLDGRLTHLDLALVDPLLQAHVWAAFGMTLVAAAGVANAVNIVDGCNGLSSFVSMVALAALAAVAFWVGDEFVACSAVIGVAALFGFFVWNFPMGRIFMGDSGAYLTGFLIAELSILLVRHNPSVSPWFPLMLMMYPVWETLYSMYRRAQTRVPVGSPDILHLHQLIYYRLIRIFQHSRRHEHEAARSSVASLYLWVLTLLCAGPALLFWDNTPVLKALCLLFAVSYLLFHKSLVRFRSPRFLIIRNWRLGLGTPDEAPVAEDSQG
jgi:UDP-GlcNAc:undecaprenyl-phosphate/decaprenyl-phosphate GlcNAc-1-phosphate transferase